MEVKTTKRNEPNENTADSIKVSKNDPGHAQV